MSAVAGADNFSRAVTAGWGSADRGGAWSVATGSADRFSVDGSQGTIPFECPFVL